MTDTIQINSLKRKLGTLMIIAGIKYLRDSYSDFLIQEKNYNDILYPIKKLNIQLGNYDDKYNFTTWDNWQKIINILDPIIAEFK